MMVNHFLDTVSCWNQRRAQMLMGRLTILVERNFGSLIPRRSTRPTRNHRSAPMLATATRSGGESPPPAHVLVVCHADPQTKPQPHLVRLLRLERKRSIRLCCPAQRRVGTYKHCHSVPSCRYGLCDFFRLGNRFVRHYSIIWKSWISPDGWWTHKMGRRCRCGSVGCRRGGDDPRSVVTPTTSRREEKAIVGVRSIAYHFIQSFSIPCRAPSHRYGHGHLPPHASSSSLSL